MNSFRPSFSTSFRAVASPLRKVSKRAPGVIRVASNTSMARAMLSKLTGSLSVGKAFLNRATYSGMLFRVFTTFSGVLFISTPAWIGPLACSARSLARPSQNWATLNTELNTVGELRGPCFQPWPVEVCWKSAPPMPTLWQVLQLIRALFDNRGSK